MSKVKRRRTSTKDQNAAGSIRVWLAVGMCLAIVIAGLFFAATQHFTSIDYNMRNGRLRKQVDELESERRRLIAAKENSASPAELLRTARKLSLIAEPAATAIVDRPADPARPVLSAAAARPRPAEKLVAKTALVASPSVRGQERPQAAASGSVERQRIVSMAR